MFAILTTDFILIVVCKLEELAGLKCGGRVSNIYTCEGRPGPSPALPAPARLTSCRDDETLFPGPVLTHQQSTHHPTHHTPHTTLLATLLC